MKDLKYIHDIEHECDFVYICDILIYIDGNNTH